MAFEKKRQEPAFNQVLVVWVHKDKDLQKPIIISDIQLNSWTRKCWYRFFIPESGTRPFCPSISRWLGRFHPPKSFVGKQICSNPFRVLWFWQGEDHFSNKHLAGEEQFLLGECFTCWIEKAEKVNKIYRNRNGFDRADTLFKLHDRNIFSLKDQSEQGTTEEKNENNNKNNEKINQIKTSKTKQNKTPATSALTSERLHHIVKPLQPKSILQKTVPPSTPGRSLPEAKIIP